MKQLCILVLLLLLAIQRSVGDVFLYDEVVFIIASEEHNDHETCAAAVTKQKLVQSLKASNFSTENVFQLNRDIKVKATWTIFPFLPTLSRAFGTRMKWFVFISESSEVNLEILSQVLSQFKSDFGIFVGHSLTLGPIL